MDFAGIYFTSKGPVPYFEFSNSSSPPSLGGQEKWGEDVLKRIDQIVTCHGDSTKDWKTISSLIQEEFPETANREPEDFANALDCYRILLEMSPQALTPVPAKAALKEISTTDTRTTAVASRSIPSKKRTFWKTEALEKMDALKSSGEKWKDIRAAIIDEFPETEKRTRRAFKAALTRHRQPKRPAKERTRTAKGDLWLPSESWKLIQFIDATPPTRKQGYWEKIAESSALGKTAPQCRSHWCNLNNNEQKKLNKIRRQFSSALLSAEMPQKATTSAAKESEEVENRWDENAKKKLFSLVNTIKHFEKRVSTEAWENIHYALIKKFPETEIKSLSAVKTAYQRMARKAKGLKRPLKTRLHVPRRKDGWAYEKSKNLVKYLDTIKKNQHELNEGYYTRIGGLPGVEETGKRCLHQWQHLTKHPEKLARIRAEIAQETTAVTD